MAYALSLSGLLTNSHVEMIMMSNFFDIGLVLAKVLITRKSQDCS